MVSSSLQRIFLVDDDQTLLQAADRILGDNGFALSCFDGAADCLEQLQHLSCDLIMIDLKTPCVDGVRLLREIQRVAPWIPVLVITDVGDVSRAFSAGKLGASDLVERPLRSRELLRKVESLLQRNAIEEYNDGARLTKAEMRVLMLLIDGKTNKEAAHLLHRSRRTIEVHRRRIMQKLGVDNMADLVKRAIKMGLIQLSHNCIEY